MSRLQGKFVWFEHSSADVAQARRFYESLFDWHIESMSMGERSYSMILNGNDGIGGLVGTASGTPSRWISYLSVADVDRSYAQALAAGATAAQPPTDFGDVGRGAGIVDPTGAALSLWTGARDDRPDSDNVPVGDWYWNELTTPDETRALAFYERVIGYEHDTMEMEGQGRYYILKSGGRMRGGLMRLPMPDAPTAWQPYVRVADCDATVKRAESLGARTVVPGTDIPQVGRFAVIVDPLGVTTAFMQPVAS